MGPDTQVNSWFSSAASGIWAGVRGAVRAITPAMLSSSAPVARVAKAHIGFESQALIASNRHQRDTFNSVVEQLTVSDFITLRGQYGWEQGRLVLTTRTVYVNRDFGAERARVVPKPSLSSWTWRWLPVAPSVPRLPFLTEFPLVPGPLQRSVCVWPEAMGSWVDLGGCEADDEGAEEWQKINRSQLLALPALTRG